MADEKVIITGVSGLLGSAIAQKLSQAYTVIGMDLNPAGEGVRFYKTDLTDKNSVEASLKKIAQEHGERFASVIHLAAYYDFSGAPSEMYEKLTVNGTRQLIKTLKGLDFQVEQFLFASTHLVMRPAEKGELIVESDPLQGDWDYPRSKIAAENVLKKELGDFPGVVFRISGVYDEEGHSPPICRQIQRIYEKQITGHFYPGDQEKGQPFVHLKDAVQAFELAVQHRQSFGPRETFFIAEPELLSYGQLQDRIGRLLYDKEWMTMRTPKGLAKAGAYVMNKRDESSFIKPWMIDLTEAHYPLSQKRAREKLGFIARHRLYEELPEIIARLRRDPAAWYRENKLGAPPRHGDEEDQSSFHASP